MTHIHYFWILGLAVMYIWGDKGGEIIEIDPYHKFTFQDKGSMLFILLFTKPAPV